MAWTAAGTLLSVVIWKLSKGINEALGLNWLLMQIASAWPPWFQTPGQMDSALRMTVATTLLGTSRAKSCLCLLLITHSHSRAFPGYPSSPPAPAPLPQQRLYVEQSWAGNADGALDSLWSQTLFSA